MSALRPFCLILGPPKRRSSEKSQSQVGWTASQIEKSGNRLTRDRLWKEKSRDNLLLHSVLPHLIPLRKKDGRFAFGRHLASGAFACLDQQRRDYEYELKKERKKKDPNKKRLN